MNLKFIPNKSMERFHNNINIQTLVSLCMDNYYNTIFDDILLLISSKKYLELLNELEEKYLNTEQFEIFKLYKKCILNIYDDSQIKNLKGAFLEVLSFNIFNNYYNPFYSSTDCFICIDDWKSEKTVDIAMLYDNSALVGECKVPVSKFNWKIFKNLLDIKSNFDGNMSLYAITLDNQIRMDKKMQKIIFEVPECETLDDILVITRDTFNQYNI